MAVLRPPSVAVAPPTAPPATVAAPIRATVALRPPSSTTTTRAKAAPPATLPRPAARLSLPGDTPDSARVRELTRDGWPVDDAPAQAAFERRALALEASGLPWSEAWRIANAEHPVPAGFGGAK